MFFLRRDICGGGDRLGCVGVLSMPICWVGCVPMCSCAPRDDQYGDESSGGPLGFDAAAAEVCRRTVAARWIITVFAVYLDGQIDAAREAAHAFGIALKGYPHRCRPDGGLQSPESIGHVGGLARCFGRGQNWGFPTDLRGHVARLRRLAAPPLKKYFDAYRLDHVLGFFPRMEIARP